jgi:hypothetical protein
LQDRAGNLNFVIPRCAIAHLRMRSLGAGPESILPAGVRDSGLALRTPRNDGVYAATLSHSRRATRPSFAPSRALFIQREQGMPGARCARGLACKGRKHASKSPRSRPRHSPRNGFTAYSALSRVTGLSCHPRRRNYFRQLDASVGASGPHGFAVRVQCHSSFDMPRPPHPAPRP